MRGYCDYEERRTNLLTHQHLPHPGVTFIIGLEGELEVRDATGEQCRIGAGQGFLAGVSTTPARTRSERNQHGVEIALTPIGAHLLLEHMPMDALTNRAVSIEDLLGRSGRELGERLANSRDDRVRFDLLDAFFAHRLLGTRSALPEGLAYAWDALSHSHGRVRIANITDDLGWSRRRLVETFRRAVGLTPKVMGRVLRFDHALELWKADPSIAWTDVALGAGYHDQAHFSREVRDLSGQSPSELTVRLLPESGGMAA